MAKNVKKKYPIFEKEGYYVTYALPDEIYKFGIKKNEQTILDKYEVLYIVERQRGYLVTRSGKSLNDYVQVIEYLDIDILQYHVFRDLRDKGYRVKVVKDLIYIYPKSSLDEEPYWLCKSFYSLDEIKMKDLLELIERSRLEKAKLLIAVVDPELDVTYYEVFYARDVDR